MKKFPDKCDLLVIGAGPAGVSAAVTAARQGLNTVLVEQSDRPGGTPRLCGHRHICGLYLQNDASPFLLNPGLTTEIVEQLGGKPRKMGRVWVHPVQPQSWVALLESIIQQEPRLNAFFQMKVMSARRKEKIIDRVIVQDRDRDRAIIPDAVIDASGSRQILESAGIPFAETPPAGRQLAGFTARVTGLIAPDETLPVRVPYVLLRAVMQGRLPPPLQYTTFSPGEIADEGLLKINQFAAEKNDPAFSRSQAETVHRLLAEQLPMFHNSVLKSISGPARNREGPRLQGDYTLTAEDIFSDRQFPDKACRGAWPLELWEPGEGLQLRYLMDNTAYDIPRGCLVSETTANLFAAGLLLSTSREAQGSTRVTGTCLATGEAAGRMAAQGRNY